MKNYQFVILLMTHWVFIIISCSERSFLVRAWQMTKYDPLDTRDTRPPSPPLVREHHVSTTAGEVILARDLTHDIRREPWALARGHILFPDLGR